MFGVVLPASASGWEEWLAVTLGLIMLGLIGAFTSGRVKALLIVALVVGLVTFGVATAYAVYIPCPPYWKGWLC